MVKNVMQYVRAFLSTGMAFGAALVLTAHPIDSQTERFEAQSTVVLVEVPLQVVHRGAPVRGLTQNDFEVKDEGKVQEIVGFEVIDLATSVSLGEGPRQIPLSARRHFMLLFDLSFSDPADIEGARLAGLDLMTDAIHDTDLVAVATYTASRGAELVLGFTTDQVQVERALQSLSLAQPIRHFRDPLALTVADSFDSSHPYRGGGGAGNNKADRYEAMLQNYRDLSAFEARSQREQREADILALTSSLEELGKLMRGVAGRKHVVLLSEGFDSSIVVGTEDSSRMQEITRDSMAGEVWRVDSEERFGSSQTKQALGRAMEEFRRADCVIHAVDIGGVRAGADMDPRTTGQDGLFLMADQTGGEFYRNFNDLGGAMAEVLERTSVTYVLAFQPENLALDGRFHRLKVRLVGDLRGARVIHRPGYYAPRPYSELSTEEQRIQTAGLIIGGREGGDFPISVLAAPFGGSEDRFYVPVLVEVDGSSLVAGRREGTVPLELYAYAVSESGAILDFATQALNLDIEKMGEQLQQSGFKFWGHFELPPDDYVLRVLVRNAWNGTMALRMVPLHVPELGGGEACLLPPFVPEPAGKWLISQDTTGRPDVPYPFIRDGEPFIPAARPELRAGEDISVSLVAFNLGDNLLDARAELFRLDGSSAGALEIADLRKEMSTSDGLLRLTARLRSAEIEPGDYELVITAAGRGALTGTSHIPIRIQDRS